MTITDALRTLISSFNDNSAEATFKKLTKDKAVKEAFAPVSKLIKYGGRDVVMQVALELAAEHPLRQAAVALVDDKALIPHTPWVNIQSAPQPKRWTLSLLISKRDPVVYAREDQARISVWSLEDGSHVADLKIPGKKGTEARELVELDDGTLRILATDGHVCERKPGANEFKRVHEVGELKSDNAAASSDLRYVVRQKAFQPEDTPEGSFQPFEIHDVQSRSTTEVRIKALYKQVGPRIVGNTAIIGLNRSINDESSEGILALVDVTTGAFDIIVTKHEPYHLVAHRDVIEVHLRDDDGNTTCHHLDIAAKKLTPAEEKRGDDTIRFGDVAFDPSDHAFLDEDGKRALRYVVPDYPYKKVAVADAARNQLVLAGGDPNVPVTIIRRFDAAARPSSVARPSAAAKPLAEPLSWAKKGTVLRYEIADFDAQDQYSFEVIEADDDTLALRIVMDDDEEVASALRMTAEALAKATKVIGIAQGGADVDVNKPQKDALPPIIVSRGVHAKLASGKKASLKSAWGGESLGLTASPGQATVRVGDKEQPVKILSASADEGAMNVLDDPTWPLVIERTEGECFVRLTEIKPRSPT
jgi:hypothetical protein